MCPIVLENIDINNLNIFDFMQSIASILSLIFFIILTYIVSQRDNKNHRRESINRLFDRLYELNKVAIEYPDIHKFFYDTRDYKGEFFTEATPHDEHYFRIKAIITHTLNFFDELLCIMEKDKNLKNEFEFPSSEQYIIEKLRHPLYKELFHKERKIFGKSFKKFFEDNKLEISKKGDPEID